MRCPFCGHEDTQVKDSRPTDDNSAIRRRRYCPSCGSRFTTFERVQLRELTVIKKNGQRVQFDRDKLALARRSLGRTWPNPAVGCVIVKDGTVVGRGRTRDGGRPHAEVDALNQAGEAARGATVYVTLEPCSHFGKSPPCADALIKAGV